MLDSASSAGHLEYYDGGGNASVFAAGVAAGLEAGGVRSPNAVIANSGGLVASLSRACRTSEQNLELFEEFVRYRTLDSSRIIRNILSTAWWRFGGVPSRREDMVADVQRLLQIMRERGLTPERIRDSTVACFTRLFHLPTGKVELVDLRSHSRPIRALVQSVACEPYYRCPCTEEYIDPMTEGERGYVEIAARFPVTKIVAVENSPDSGAWRLGHHVTNMLQGLLSMDQVIARAYRQRESRRWRERKMIERSGDGIILVSPPTNFAVTAGTNNVRAIRDAYSMGLRASDNLMRVLEKEGLH